MRRRRQGRRLRAWRGKGRAGAAWRKAATPSSSRMPARGPALRNALGAGVRHLCAERHSARRRGRLRGGRADCRLQQPAQLARLARMRRARAARLPVAVQVDSGMSRLGMPPAEVEAHRGRSRRLRRARPPAGDEPSRLRRRAGPPGQRGAAPHLRGAARESCRRRRPRSPIRRASFSATAFHFDLARPGAALYGINPTPGHAEPDAAGGAAGGQGRSRRATLEAGVGVGYGHAFRTAAVAAPWRRSRSAMPTAGRAAPSPAPGIDGVRLPFAGRVSMDSIILDISALPPGRLQAGDLVELIGPHQTVDDVAGAGRHDRLRDPDRPRPALPPRLLTNDADAVR